MIETHWPKKLEPFLTVQKRFKIAYGGRGAAKSQTFAEMLVHLSMKEGSMTGCLREFQNSIEDSVYSLIKARILALCPDKWVVFKSYLDHIQGGGFRFKGLSRSIDSIKSAHGFKRFWLEEGQFISATSLKVLTPTLREDDSELWISANPMNSNDPFSARFITPFLDILERDGYYEDDLHLIVKINHSDNPWFPETLELERRHDFHHLSRALYDHIWEGAFNDSVDNSIIPAEWFDAAIDSHIKLGFKPTGIKAVAHDPSDLGPDNKALAYRHGSVILDVREKSDGTVNEGADWALGYANEQNADYYVWDGDGMGVALLERTEKALKGKHMISGMFRGGVTPMYPGETYSGKAGKGKSNADVFYNASSQFAWYLRDRFYKTYLAVEKGEYHNPDELISISSKIKNINKLRSEICRIPRKHNANGKIQIMPKPEMKRLYKIESPNMFDSVKMCFMIPQNKRTSEKGSLVFDSLW